MSVITQAMIDNGARDFVTLEAVTNALTATTTTRNGDTIDTLFGALSRLHYAVPIAFTTGIVVNSATITVLQASIVYAPVISAIPFTTTGVFNGAQWYPISPSFSAFMIDLADEVDATAARAKLVAAASGTNTDITGVTLNNTGLKVKDTDASHNATFKANSNLTANRTWNFVFGDADRSLTLAADVSISSFVATLLDDAAASNFLTTLGVSAFIQTLLDDAAAINARATLGLRFIRYCDIGDETTTITTGVGKFFFRMPFAATLVAVRASLTNGSTTGIPTFDINKNGTTVMAVTKLTIDATEKTSATAAVAAVISTTAFALDDEVSIDYDVVGTGTPKGVKIQLEFSY